jgi:hypothetical protein
MQDLHRDLAARVMDGIGDDAVIGDVLIGEQARRTGKHAAFAVGGHAARHDQPTCPRARSA